MLFFNQKVSAVEAFERNLVTEVIPSGVYEKETEAKMKQFAAFPPQVNQLIFCFCLFVYCFFFFVFFLFF